MPKINVANFPKLPKEHIQKLSVLEQEIKQGILDLPKKLDLEKAKCITNNLIKFNTQVLVIVTSQNEGNQKQLKSLLDAVCDLNTDVSYKFKITSFLRENSKILTKIWVALSEYIDISRIELRIAQVICSQLSLMTEAYFLCKQLDKAFYTATQLMLWHDKASDMTKEQFFILNNLYEGGKLILTTKQERFHSLTQANLIFIHYYAQQGQFQQVINLLTTLAQNNEFVYSVFLDDMFDFFDSLESHLIWEKKQIAHLLLQYVSKTNPHPLSLYGIEYIEDKKNNLLDVIEKLNNAIAKGYLNWVKNLRLKSSTAKYYENKKCLQLKWDMTKVPFAAIETLLKKLKPNPTLHYRAGQDLLVYKLENIFPCAVLNILSQIDDVIAKYPIQSALDDCIKQLRRIRFDLPAPAMPSPIPANPMVNPMDMLNTSKKSGTKIKKLAIVKEKKEVVLSPPKPSMTAHELGFKLNEPNIPVYPISAGDHIPPGIYYSYGIRLDKGQREVSEADLKEYQQILEEGQIVTRGRRGLRLVRPKESGIDERVLFKVTHPRRDLRILMLPEETVTDEYGQKKYLYRAGMPKFHK